MKKLNTWHFVFWRSFVQTIYVYIHVSTYLFITYLVNIYFKELFTNKAYEVYLFIACEKHFTMLQEIKYTIACKYLFTTYLACEYLYTICLACEFTMWKKKKTETLVPKRREDHVSLIGAYWFNEIEPYAQISKRYNSTTMLECVKMKSLKLT